jgi:hypothetical protein
MHFAPRRGLHVRHRILRRNKMLLMATSFNRFLNAFAIMERAAPGAARRGERSSCDEAKESAWVMDQTVSTLCRGIGMRRAG